MAQIGLEIPRKIEGGSGRPLWRRRRSDRTPLAVFRVLATQGQVTVITNSALEVVPVLRIENSSIEEKVSRAGGSYRHGHGPTDGSVPGTCNE